MLLIDARRDARTDGSGACTGDTRVVVVNSDRDAGLQHLPVSPPSDADPEPGKRCQLQELLLGNAWDGPLAERDIGHAGNNSELVVYRLFVIQSALTSEWSAPLCRSERIR